MYARDLSRKVKSAKRQRALNGLNLYCYCMNNPIMYADPSGHFSILSLIISFVASVAFEIIEDAMDGELFTDDSHEFKDYLGAGISGVLGGMSGDAGFVLGVFGDLVDAAISGDLAEDGIFNTIGNIAVSTFLSSITGGLFKRGVSKLKANSLIKLENNRAANKVLRKMRISGTIGKKSNADLSKMIRKSNWIGNTIVEKGVSSIVGGVSSTVWSCCLDGWWF